MAREGGVRADESVGWRWGTGVGYWQEWNQEGWEEAIANPVLLS